VADLVTFKVEGFRELDAALKEVEYELAQRIARSMTAAGAKVIRDSARQKAPEAEAPHTLTVKGDTVIVQPGNLRENIVSKRVTKTELASEHIVTVRGKKRNSYAARYGRLQEFGTVNHPPQPFLRPAFDENIQAAIAAMRKTGERRIASAARKAAKGRK
jgi:HK97 gp10 family phage protein